MVHCIHCNYAGLGQDRLNRHMKQCHNHFVRNGRHKCEWCEYSTDRSDNLANHRRTHTGEWPYRCDDCGKTFTHLSRLTVHHRVHFGQRPYVCEVCGKAFTLAGNLKSHIRIHTGERPYHCDDCEQDVYYTESSDGPPPPAHRPETIRV